MTVFAQVAEHGQSIWYDYIQRSMILDGTLHRLVVDDDLKGVTSNPAIFNKAIGGSTDYDPALAAEVAKGGSAGEIFERIAVADIQWATDVLRPVYQKTDGRDGYVSLEVSPYLAYSTDETIAEARRLWAAVHRDNVMIKIPATPEGLPAIERCIADGINVNVTLLFAVDAYEAVADAYMTGLEKLVANGGDASRVASVASFFVSRIDALVDKQLKQREAGEHIRGKVAIANAKQAYRSYEQMMKSDRWAALKKAGARPQRLLWASTGVKDPSYRDVLYIEELIGPDTVNTVPEATYDAFKDHGKAACTLTEGYDEADEIMAELAKADVSMKAVTDALLDDGVVKFADAFDTLLSTVERRRRELLGARVSGMNLEAPTVEGAVNARIEDMRKSGFVRKLWAKDASLFGAAEAADYMGWLDIGPRTDRTALAALSTQIASMDVDHVVLMGMGGSSLAPEVFAKVLPRGEGHPELLVLDSTVPAQVAAIDAKIDPRRTAFIVASKSGSTTEPLAFDAHFAAKVEDGERFFAITDPGSLLEGIARKRGFAGVLPGDPQVGGRYSALSNFGMAAIAAFGGDVEGALDAAALMSDSCAASVPAADNPGVRLGVTLGELAKAGRDKLTIAATAGLVPFGAWLEQLVAESTGKGGKGIVPVDSEPKGDVEAYGNDRVFAYFRLAGDDATASDATIAALVDAGHPVLTFDVSCALDVVQQMYLWEMATAVAGHVLEINPFDQPNVQESKEFTRTFLGALVTDGRLPAVPGEKQVLEVGGITVYADEANASKLAGARSLVELLQAHVARAGEGDYVALNAYVQMSEANIAVLQAIRASVRDARKTATTLGFGPRFLHSTGQLHKGGANNGVFLQITSDDAVDVPVPGEAYTFGVLKTAQANGDFVALSKRGRRLLRVHLSADVASDLAIVASALS